MSESARKLHQTPHQGVFHVTGGGSLLLSDLLTEPGASATLLAASVPYATTALTQLIGKNPHRSSSAGTARALAMAAWQQARALAPAQGQLFGFGCTAALATNRPKRGAHRAHLAVQTLGTTNTLSFVFDKSDTDREREETKIVELAYLLLQETLAIQLGASDEHASQPEDLSNTISKSPAPPNWQALYNGKVGKVLASANTKAPRQPTLLMPGSFNPLHNGHMAMAAYASTRYAQPVDFELSVHNVDKPSLDYADLQLRTQQFADHTLWLTGLPTFLDKAREFPGVTFLVGADTALRIGQTKYYRSESAMHAAIEEMASLETQYLVFGRAQRNRFASLDDLDLPPALRALCTGVSESDFRLDLSSTQLRETSATQAD